MTIQKNIAVIAVYLFFGWSIAADRPCLDYTELGYEYRSVNYTVPASQPKQCDSYNVKVPDLWYRFSQYTGGKMPEFCPPLYSCATQYPIWMNGTHPTIVNMETPAVACTHRSSLCCGTAKPMSVMLCNEGGEEYYVYKLPVVDECPSYYCAGDMIPCEYHQTWDYDQEMCVDKPPATTTSTTPIPTSSGRSLLSSNPTGSTTPTTPPDGSTSNNNNIGLIVGLALACAGIGAIVATLFIWQVMKRPKSPTATATKIYPETTANFPEPPGYAASPPPYSYPLVEKH